MRSIRREDEKIIISIFSIAESFTSAQNEQEGFDKTQEMGEGHCSLALLRDYSCH